eukprot:COSAG05_NODE_469_length_9505_cov_14.573676_1_plen_487_part_00
MAEAQEENNLKDIFGDSSDDDDDDVPLEKETSSTAAVATEKSAAAAKKMKTVDSDSDGDLELDLSDDSDDDTAARLAALVKEQKKKPRRKSAPKEKKKTKTREKKAGKIPKRKREAAAASAATGDEAGSATAEDLAFIEKGSDDDDDDDDVIKTKGGWTEDNAIEGSDDEHDETDKRWLDKMWGRGGKKKREKTIDEYKTMAMKFKEAMDSAQDEDEAANRRGEPALERLSMIQNVRTEMRKQELQHLYFDECGILHTFKRWLAPLNGKAFPNYNLKHGVLEIVDEMTDPDRGGRAINTDQVKDSGIGGIIMLYKTKDKNSVVRNLCTTIIDRWSRPVLGVGADKMRKLHDQEKEGKDGRKYTKVAAKRDKMKSDTESKYNADKDKIETFLKERAASAKLGQPGFVFHAGWPMPGEKNYKKNVMRDRQLSKLEHELEERNNSLEEFLKHKPAPKEMDRTMNRTTANNKRRRMQAVKNVIDSRSVCD